MEERLKLVKEDKEKEKMIKSNKLYISENNIRIKHMREENAREYKINLKLEKMNKKRELIKEKKEKEIKENNEKRKIKEDIIKDKQIMMERLKDIMNCGQEFTKDEVNDYVLNGIKPKIKTKEDENKKFLDTNKNRSSLNKEKVDEYDGQEAFITELPEN